MVMILFQADNLIFKDRKLNIGQAIKKQVSKDCSEMQS